MTGSHARQAGWSDIPEYVTLSVCSFHIGHCMGGICGCSQSTLFWRATWDLCAMQLFGKGVSHRSPTIVTSERDKVESQLFYCLSIEPLPSEKFSEKCL